MPQPPRFETRWADGLRGCASFIVISAHITRSLAPYMLSPAMSEYEGALLFQLPFFRLFIMGRSSVALFALLSGYVNALKPIKQSRAGSFESGLAGVAKSSFRRTGRFMVPSIIATCLSWLACQLGAYTMAHAVMSDWINDTSPHRSHSLGAALYSLYSNLVTTWISGANVYDPIQWTLTWLLKGSFIVYMTLVATIYVKPKRRMLLYVIMYIYMYKSKDTIIGVNVFFGLLLAELSLDADVQQWAADHPNSCTIFSTLCFGIAMYFCSYPESNPEWRAWSNNLKLLGDRIFPSGSEYARFFPSLGAEIFSLGVVFSPNARKLFSHWTISWLGKMSFAIYLLHAPLIRTVLTWMLFGVRVPVGGGPNGDDPPAYKHQLPSKYICALAIPLFYIFLYRVAFYWSVYVEPLCGKVTNKLEDFLFSEQAKAESEKPMALPSAAA